MIDEHILVPPRWRRGLALDRVVVALAALGIEFFFASPSSVLIRLLLVLFLVYSILATYWRNVQRSTYALLSVLLDCIFFLICATIQSPYVGWLSAFFYLYLIVSVVLFRPWRHVLTMGIALPILFSLVSPGQTERFLPVFVAAGILGLITARHRQFLFERLVNSSRQAALFRSESEKAREAERDRIAADFHDGPQQSFISLQMRLEVLRRILDRDPEAAKQELAQLQELVRSQVAEVRAFVRGMRPVDLDGAGLSATVSRLVDRFEKDSGITATFSGNGEVKMEDSEVARELVQIVREALHNTQKHAGATRVAVGIESANGRVELSVQDDGSGFPFAGSYSLEELDLLRLGPASIRRRVRGLGGEMTLDSQPGLGASLRIRIPA